MTEQEKQEQQQFLTAIQNDRYDPSLRLVYADWLEERGLDDVALEQRRRATQEWIEADKWMHDFAGKCGSTCVRNYGADDERTEDWREVTYDDVIEAGFDWINNEDWFCQVGSERARNLVERIKEEYWDKWSIVTGIYPTEQQRKENPFSCSC